MRAHSLSSALGVKKEVTAMMAKPASRANLPTDRGVRENSTALSCGVPDAKALLPVA